MKRKYEVFLSSTCEDLGDVRQALILATAKAGHLLNGMEFFPPGPRDQDLIDRSIREADIFVILVGSRYGSEVKGLEEHFVEFEYNLATKYNKPILAFLLEDAECRELRERIPTGEHERTHDVELDEFRKRVCTKSDGTGRIVNFFTLKPDAASLVTKYHLALDKKVRQLEEEKEGGWIRFENYVTLNKDYEMLVESVHLDKSVSRNPFFSKFVTSLNTFDVLSDRVSRRVPELKRAIAAYFLAQYLGRMVELDYRKLFFESGSSIAFLSEQLIARRREDWVSRAFPNLLLETNNIITYLDFVLSERVPIDLYPYGPPEAKYGATFGPLTAIPRREPPVVGPCPLSKQAENAVETISAHFKDRYHEKGLVFMAISGVDLAPDEWFRGPHVGSYYNCLFKRAILTADVPIVMFLDETKLPSPFQIGQCFPVCTDPIFWPDICQRTPLALAVAARESDRMDELEELFLTLGLSHLERGFDTERKVHTLIGSNEGFQSLWA